MHMEAEESHVVQLAVGDPGEPRCQVQPGAGGGRALMMS